MVDQRDLNVMASIADIAAKVVNDRQKTDRTLAHTKGMSPETVHATLHKDMMGLTIMCFFYIYK